MDKMLGDGNSNSIERKLDNVMNGPERHQDFCPYLIEMVHLMKKRSGTLMIETALLDKTDLQNSL